MEVKDHIATIKPILTY